MAADAGRVLYVVETNCGYALRKAIDFLKGDKKAPKFINFIINNHHLVHYNVTETETVKITLPMRKCVRFETDFTGDMVVGLNLDELTKGLKSCKKGHHLTLYQFENLPSIFFRVGPDGTNENNFPCAIYNNISQVQVAQRPRDSKHFLTIPLNIFSESVKSIRDVNPEYVNVTFSKGQMVMNAMSDKGASLRSCAMGYSPAIVAPVRNIRMSISSVKALGKLSAVSAPGIVTVTSNADDELHITIPISVVGKIELTYKDIQRV